MNQLGEIRDRIDDHQRIQRQINIIHVDAKGPMKPLLEEAYHIIFQGV